MARKFLGRLSGRVHEVVTGVCLFQREMGRMHLFSEATRVRFLPFGETVIEDYLARVQVLDKAGAYAIQEQGHLLVEGSVSNVIGLPVEALRLALRKWSPDLATA